MADPTFALLNDAQLANLFAATTPSILTARAKDIVNEMERRGFIYDIRKGEFITCEQWNGRYGRYIWMQCKKQAEDR